MFTVHPIKSRTLTVVRTANLTVSTRPSEVDKDQFKTLPPPGELI